MFVRRLQITTAAAATILLAPTAAAQDGPLETAIAETKALFNFRLRYEGVDQASFAEDASALTYRIRAGLETGKAYDTSFLIDFDLVEDVVDDFNSTINGKTQFPVIADPQVSELNRIQLTNTSLPDTKVTLGRQRIIFDDSRFVGNVGWRQNEQTFDAVRAQNTSIGALNLDVVYLNQANRIFGDDSPAGRWEGDSYLVNASYPTPLGKLTGFGYFIDVDELGGAPSSQTIGGLFAGAQDAGPGKFGYTLSYASQSDYGSSQIDYSADYILVSGDYTVSGVKLGLAYEALGGDDARGFQTPFATLHKFQGWADVFLVTPTQGVEDFHATAGYTLGDWGPLKGVRFMGVYHDFQAETTSTDFGSEVDLLAAAQWRDLKFTLKYADYQSDGFAVDTQKVWFQIDYGF